MALPFVQRDSILEGKFCVEHIIFWWKTRSCAETRRPRQHVNGCYTGELGYDGLNGTRKIGPSYAKSVVYIWRILDMHRTGTKHIVRHMQRSVVQWSVISKFTGSSISLYFIDNWYNWAVLVVEYDHMLWTHVILCVSCTSPPSWTAMLQLSWVSLHQHRTTP